MEKLEVIGGHDVSHIVRNACKVKRSAKGMRTWCHKGKSFFATWAGREGNFEIK